jgi:hypothetical protein
VANSIRLDAIAESYRSRRSSEAGAGEALDDRTWQDLNLDEVFAALERTESTLGQHALYYRLRKSPADDLESFESLVERFDRDGRWRARAQRALKRLRDPHGYDLWWLARPNAVEHPSWYVMFPILGALAIALLCLLPAWPQLAPWVIASLGVNVAVSFVAAGRVSAVAAAFRQIAPIVGTAQRLGVLPDAVRRLRRLKTVSRWISADPLMLPVAPASPALLLNDVIQVFYAYLNLGFLLDGSGAYFGAGDLRTHGAALLRVVAAVGDIDAALSVSRVRRERNDWVTPRFRSAGAEAVLVGLRHPLIHDAVPNSVTLQPGRGSLITGSNMSGKSTFLRTVGVNAVLAQTVNMCFAVSYDAPILVVRSAIGRADDLASGKSYYIVEAELLLSLVRASASAAPHLFLLDELFRGTNATERIAAGQAVLRELVEDEGAARVHVAVAATHDAELVGLLQDRYAAHHFSDALGGNGLLFDYRLRAGAASTRNAIALLRLQGAPEPLIRRALACAETLDRQRGTSLTGR